MNHLSEEQWVALGRFHAELGKRLGLPWSMQVLCGHGQSFIEVSFRVPPEGEVATSCDLVFEVWENDCMVPGFVAPEGARCSAGDVGGGFQPGTLCSFSFAEKA